MATIRMYVLELFWKTDIILRTFQYTYILTFIEHLSNGSLDIA